MDVEEIRHLASQARELKDDPAFQAAVWALRKQWFAQLMATKNREAIEPQVIQLQVLEAIPQQLQVFINDHEMAKRRGK